MTQTANATPVSWRTVGHVGVVTLNAPQRRNPLSVETMLALTQTLRTLAGSDLRALVLTATGPAFSAGHDLREMLDRSVEDEREIFRVCTELIEPPREVRRLASLGHPASARSVL